MKLTEMPEIGELLARAYDLADVTPEDMHFTPQELELDLSMVPPPVSAPHRLAPARSGKHTQKISIRIQHGTLDAVKAQAHRLGIPYQRLINRQLRAANCASGMPAA